jgi:hypothetical protein
MCSQVVGSTVQTLHTSKPYARAGVIDWGAKPRGLARGYERLAQAISAVSADSQYIV